MDDQDFPPPSNPYPDLSVAYTRGPRHFDGNAQSHIRLWYWAYVERLEEEDFEALGASDAMDWVIIPVPGLI